MAFLLFGAVYFTWAARLPAVKDDLGLSNGELAVALIGLEAGALVGLQLGGSLVPRTGSRTVLAVSLPLLGVLLAGPALAGNLVTLTAAAAVLAVTINVANVAMNAHGVAVEQRYGRPILSGLYAMHSLGGIAGAGVAALAAGLGVGRAGHLLTMAAAAALAAVATSRLLLPPSIDASPARPASSGRGRSAFTAALAGWLRGWSGWVMVLGALAFCVELAQTAAAPGARSGCATASGPAPARPLPGWPSSWRAPPPAGWPVTVCASASARPGCSVPGRCWRGLGWAGRCWPPRRPPGSPAWPVR